jgi:hypothetical protein
MSRYPYVPDELEGRWSLYYGLAGLGWRTIIWYFKDYFGPA